MYATTYFESIILNLARGISAPAPSTMYLALFLNNPGEEGGGVEVAWSGYARQPITFSAPAPAGEGIGIQNAEAITFPSAPAAVGNVTYVGVMDSVTGGNMYLYGMLTESLSVQAGIAPVVRAGSMQWISSGKLSNAYKTKILNVLRGTSCPGFTPYLALLSGSPESGGAEFTGGSYARMPVEFSAPAEQASGAMMIQNSAEIISATATATWGNLTHIAIYDAATSGTPYLIDAANPATNMTKDKAVIYQTGAFKFSVN